MQRLLAFIANAWAAGRSFCARHWNNVVLFASAIYPRGREAFLRDVEARAWLRELEGYEKAFAIKAKHDKAAVELAKAIASISDPDMKRKFKQELLNSKPNGPFLP